MTTVSPSECPACLAVAHGGRMRLNEETSQLIEALLRSARRQSVRARRQARDTDDDAGKQEADRQLRLIDISLEELRRTQTEKGWPSLGQLFGSHPA